MFNLRRYALTEDGSHLPEEVQNIVKDTVDSSRRQIDTRKRDVNPETSGQQNQGLNDQQRDLIIQYNGKLLLDALQPILLDYNQRLTSNGLVPTDILSRIKDLPEYQRLMATPPEDLAKQMNTAFKGEGGVPNQIPSDYEVFIQNIKKQLDTDFALKRRNKGLGAPNTAPGVRGKGASFNFQEYKIAQAINNVNSERFPVASVGDFISKFLRDLMAWNGQQEERDSISGRALEEIRSAVGQGFEEEANSALKTVQQMGPDQVDKAAEILAHIYEKWLSPIVKNDSEKQAMSEKIEGIVKFNLSDHVLNNKEAMVKTAGKDNQQYILYGPTEKRICPKLRGKNMGDFVSEYICRHHCLDGIVIDDNKTVCGEALWRANVMDKFSRDYVDADGNPQGGYIEKRFEVNHNVPEENKMRLKPGETRKPRPPEMFGNLEARMQAMRNKEGEKRDYRPETDTAKPFDWTKDVDQNNVEVAQSERDRREEASGHKIVQYTNKNEQENNPKLPKKSFNLKEFKSADTKEAYVNEPIEVAKQTLLSKLVSGKTIKLDELSEREYDAAIALSNTGEVQVANGEVKKNVMPQHMRSPGSPESPAKSPGIQLPGGLFAFNLKKHKEADSKKKS